MQLTTFLACGCWEGQEAGVPSLLAASRPLGEGAATWPETLCLLGHCYPGEEAEDWALERGRGKDGAGGPGRLWDLVPLPHSHLPLCSGLRMNSNQILVKSGIDSTL